MKNLVPRARKATKGLVSIFLISAVSALCLLTLSVGTRSWGDSEPMRVNKQLNLPPNMKIVYEEGLLSVSLKKADFGKVLKEIARQSNVEIVFNGSIKEKVTLEFVDLPLEKGLKRLLKNKSYIFTYAEKKDTQQKEGRYALNRVILMEKSASGHPLLDQPPVTPGEAGRKSTDRDVRLDHLSKAEAELINRLLSQDPQAQKETLKDFAETLDSRLKEIHGELTEALEDQGGEGGNGVDLEAIQRLLQELELGKIKTRSHD